MDENSAHYEHPMIHNLFVTEFVTEPVYNGFTKTLTVPPKMEQAAWLLIKSYTETHWVADFENFIHQRSKEG